jgi:CBS domain-containing protein
MDMDMTHDKESAPYANCGEAVETLQAVIIASGQSVLEASRIMAADGIGCLAVIEDGKLAGVISERDIVMKIVALGLDPSASTVDIAMTVHPKTVEHHQPLADAFNLMNDYGFRHVPVMLDGAVFGIISAKSLLRLLKEPE